MKRILTSLLVLLLILTSCTKQNLNVQPESTKETVTENKTVTVVDMANDEVTIKLPVKSIVNLWPAGTSSFFVMGAGDLIKGVANNGKGAMNSWTEYFYPNCFNITKLSGNKPTIEEIININPDLVIIHPTTASSGIADQIRGVGISAINTNLSNYETQVKAYKMLGEILGGEYQKKLAKWSEDVIAKKEKLRNLTKDIPNEKKPVVYYISGQNENLTTTMSSNSIMQDWIETNGGIFATSLINFSGSETHGTDITAEEIFNLNPDIIIVGGVYQHVLINQLNTLDGWKDLKAVKEGKVYHNPYGCFNWDRFGLESMLQLDYALSFIQPEVAEKNGINHEYLVKEVKDFYKYYNGKDMSNAEVENMLNGLTHDGKQEIPVEK